MIQEAIEQVQEFNPDLVPREEPEHVHDYRKVPKSERTDRLTFVCAMFRCECGDWYYM